MTMLFFMTSGTFWSNLSSAFILKWHARIFKLKPVWETLLISHNQLVTLSLGPLCISRAPEQGMVLNGRFEPEVPNDGAKVKRPGSAERAAPGSFQSWEALGEERGAQRDLREQPSSPAVGAKTTCSLQDEWGKEM